MMMLGESWFSRDRPLRSPVGVHSLLMLVLIWWIGCQGCSSRGRRVMRLFRGCSHVVVG